MAASAPRRAFALSNRRVLQGKQTGRSIETGVPRLDVLARATKMTELDATPVLVDGKMAEFPDSPGIYAVYDDEGTLQYLGLSRKVSLSITNHVNDLPDLTHAVKVDLMPDATREALTEGWKQWMEEHIAETGSYPSGNAPGEKKWQTKRVQRAKPEIKLTPGKGIEDLTCSVEDLVDKVVKDNKVVAFIKGTRAQPQCGFSYQVLTILNKNRVNYEVVNVLDELYNPGLREAIKNYSKWPTIPQVYVDGEFLGGADIMEDMEKSGELAKVLTSSKEA